MKHAWHLLGVTSLLVSGSLTLHASAAHAATTTFTVDGSGDASDQVIDGVCATAQNSCTLRAAMEEANMAPGAVRIEFAIAGAGVQTITPATALPVLANAAGGITIDGFTQLGTSANTDPLADNAVRLIEIAGPGPSGFDGIQMTSSNNVVRGIVIHGFRHTIWMYQPTSGNNILEGSLVGLLPDGSLDPLVHLVSGSSCVVIQSGAHDNRIGVPGDANRNVISGCAHQGVAFYNGGTTRNFVQNNIVGLDPTGTQRRPSVSHGIDVNTFTTKTMIGGLNPGERNVVSGNNQEGVEISHGTGTINNSIVGNFIGTDVTGLVATPATQNKLHGVRLEGKANCNNAPCGLDEGFETVTDNVIVNSGMAGVWIDKGVHDSLIARNRIGVMANGVAAPNVQFGIRLEAVTRISIADNEIAFNGRGIQLFSNTTNPANAVPSPSNGNHFSRNLIHDNGGALGIDLLPMSTVNDATHGNVNVNDDIRIPVLSQAVAGAVHVQTCADCIVELFVATPLTNFGGSSAFVGTATADATGNVQISFSTNTAVRKFTATATNSNGSTSEFARNISIPSAP